MFVIVCILTVSMILRYKRFSNSEPAVVFDLQRVSNKVVKKANACKRRNLSSLLRMPHSDEEEFFFKNIIQGSR